MSSNFLFIWFVPDRPPLGLTYLYTIVVFKNVGELAVAQVVMVPRHLHQQSKSYFQVLRTAVS